MTVISGTTFTGVSDQQSNTGQPIYVRNVIAVAKDHGLVYEGLTGKKSDLSGGAGAVTQHSHIEPGNRLYWQIMTQHFGTGNQGESDSTGATSGATSQFIEVDGLYSAAATAEDFAAFYFPIYVPPAFVNMKLTVGVRTKQGSVAPPSMRCTIETWNTPDASVAVPKRAYLGTSVAVRDATFVRMADSTSSRSMGGIDDPNLYVASVTPTSSGLQSCRINVRTGNTLVPFCGFESIFIVPTVSVVRMNNLPAKPSTPVDGSNPVVVGDVDAVTANDFMPLDSTLVVSDAALGVAAVGNNINSAYLEELATGLPVTGNTSLTLAKGHDHSNPAAAPWYGGALNYTLTCKALGTISTNSAITGPRFPAPKLAAATVAFQTFAREWFYTENFSGTQKLFCAAIVRHDNAKVEGIEVKFTTTPEGGGATAVTLTSGVAGTGGIGYELITDDGSTGNSLTWLSGGRTLLEVSARHTVNNGATDSILGYVVWFA